jgi:glycerophosphoryl diester phosphodiesterase
MGKRIFAEGHRGYSARYPENTLISFRAAIDLGVDGFEFDVWLSREGEPVVLHDGNCYRTCGVDRHVRDMTLAEIKELDAGYAKKFGDTYLGQGITVPTLREVLELVQDRAPGMALGVEIKEYTEETVDKTVSMLKEYGLFENARFYAFDLPTLRRLKEKHGGYVMGYPDFQMARFEQGGYRVYDAIGLNMRLVGSELFSFYQAKGLPMHLYCADTDDQVQDCIKKGASLITANDPVALLRALGKIL